MTDKVPVPTGHAVYWEKWVDAFEEEEKLFDEQQGVDEEEFISAEELKMLGLDNLNTSPPIKSIITPFGILPLTERSLASRHFKLWVGHSNFKLTHNMCLLIQQTRGVEAFDILTPYRFRIAIGKLFVDRNIMTSVRDNMLSNLMEIANDEENFVG